MCFIYKTLCVVFFNKTYTLVVRQEVISMEIRLSTPA